MCSVDFYTNCFLLLLVANRTSLYFFSRSKYGAPYSDVLYLHRLGRTGRAGQRGAGLLVLLPFEKRIQSKFNKNDVVENEDKFPYINTPTPDVETNLAIIRNYVSGGHPTLTPSAEAAYVSFVAHYLEYGRDKLSGHDVVDAANQLAVSFGLPYVPTLPEVILAKLQK
jgi:ATP-dependent RNA helicase MSS116, mitochondrial